MTRQIIQYILPVLAASIILSENITAQQNIPVFGKQNLIGGYEKTIEGEVIQYYSSSPFFAKDALLTRCTDGMKTILWETTNSPEKLNDDYFYFYCLAGHSSGTSGADRKFTLKINDNDYLTFTTPAKKSPPFVWNFLGKDSVAMVFSATNTDIHKDLFGELYLKIPAKLLSPGKPLTISITGNAENSNDWFMLFRYPYQEKIIITPTPFLVNTDNGIRQILQIYIDHIYLEEKSVSIKINNQTTNAALVEGFNKIEIPIDTVVKKTDLKVGITIGKVFEKEFQLIQNPVNRREVNIIHHSHNDIGYSHVQQDVVKIQHQNLIDALDMIDITSGYPEGSKFIWNAETLWPVEHFLKNAEEKDKIRFFNAVKNNSIALSSFYVGVMTGLCSAEELKWINEYAVYLREKFNIPVNTAMMSDIPGVSWSIADALISDSIRYFSNGPNYIPSLPDKGDRIGSIYKYMGDKPFYWKTTNGEDKILFWTAGLGYSAFHQIPMPELGNKIREKLVSYLNELDSVSYPYDIIQMRYTIKSDNGPVDTNLSNFVRDWNLKYVSPHLVIAHVGEMMEKFEKKYGDKLPVFSGDFTPYWEDGAYSTAKEEGENRILSDCVLQLMSLSEMMPEKKVNPEWFYEARKNIIMFHEHTWGAWNSISAPDDAFAVNQWQVKKSFIDSTRKYISLIKSVMIPDMKKSENLIVYNTLPWKRTGYFETTVPEYSKGDALVDEDGNILCVQYLNNGHFCFIAKDIPANGFKKYKFIMSGKIPDKADDNFKYLTDSTTGALAGFIFKGRTWISQKEFRGLNQALYIKGQDPSDMHTSLATKISLPDNGHFIKTIETLANIEGAKQIVYINSFFRHQNYIRLSCIIDKNTVRDKESIHIAFPFNIENPVNRIGVSDTFFITGSGQLPGSNNDFYSVQRWLDISNADYGVTICSPQGALFETGSITDERPLNKGVRFWKEKAETSSTVFLYAANNYWNTNFKADQQGKVRFDVYILFHNSFNSEETRKFGEEIHIPLLPVWE